MPPEDGDGTPIDPTPAPAGGGGAPPDPAAPTDEEIAALRASAALVAEMRATVASLTAEKAKRDAATAEAERQAKIEQGGVLDVLDEERAAKLALAEELAAATAKIEAAEQREAARLEAIATENAAAIEALPERWRAIIPDGLDPEAQRAQIARVRELAIDGTERPAGGRSAGAGHGKAPVAIPDECKAEAARHQVDPQFWYDRIWVPRMKRLAAKTPAN